MLLLDDSRCWAMFTFVLFLLSISAYARPNPIADERLEQHTGNLTRRQGTCWSCVYSPDRTITGPEDNDEHRDETLFPDMNTWVQTFERQFTRPHLNPGPSRSPLRVYRRTFPLAHEFLGGARGNFVHSMSHLTTHGLAGPSFFQSHLETSLAQMDIALHFWRAGHPGQYPSRFHIVWHLESVSRIRFL